MNNKDNHIDVEKLASVDQHASTNTVASLTEHEKELVDEYYYVIETVASILVSKKKMPPTVDYNDLLSIGFQGLVKAIRGFKSDKDAQLKTYANIRVRGEMLDFIRKEWRSKASHQHTKMIDDVKARVSQVMNNEIDKSSGKISVKNLLSSMTTSYVMSLEAVMDQYGDNVQDQSVSNQKQVEDQDEYDYLNQIVLGLAKDDQNFIDMFYRKGLSQKEISIRLNVSEATVSRSHNRIIGKLKGYLEKNQ